MNWRILAVLLLAVVIAEAGKCRGRYQEFRGRDGFVARRGCRGLDTQISEEYWTTVGYDGQLRNGRTTDEFLSFPDEENNGHRLRNAFVGYWITRSKYGENRHYEAFGHVFVKPDGRVCGWFVGLNKEVVEVCGGFRVLSRSNRNPNEPIPFEWVQGPHLRNRDTLGFHHHRVAKFAQNSDEVFFGDAKLNGRQFHGVSTTNEKFIEVTNPSDFDTRVWLLKKKSVPISDPRAWIPRNLEDTRNRQDLTVYNDPHYQARIDHMRTYPYYDRYGRPSGDISNANRPAYDSFGRRLPFVDEVQGQDWDDRSSQDENVVQTPQRVSYENEPTVGRGEPGYEDWLRRQYALRGLKPRGYQTGVSSSDAVNGVNYNQPSYTSQQQAQPGYERPGGKVWQKTGASNGRAQNTQIDGVPYETPNTQENQPDYENYYNQQHRENEIGGGVQPGNNGYGSTGYGIGTGAQPGQQISDIGTGVQPGQSENGEQTVSAGEEQQSQPGQIGRGVQPEQSGDNYAIGSGIGVQPGEIGDSGTAGESGQHGQAGNSYEIGSGIGAQPGQQGYDGSNGQSGQSGSNYPVGSGVEVQQGQPGYDGASGQSVEIGTGVQPEHQNANIGSGVAPGQPGYNNNYDEQSGRIGTGVQPGQQVYSSGIQSGSSDSSQGQSVEIPLNSGEQYRNVDVYGRPLNPDGTIAAAPGTQHLRLARFRPKTIVRDKNGNVYEQRIEGGKIYFYSDPHSGANDQKKIEIPGLEPQIERELAERRRQEEYFRRLVEQNHRSGENQSSRNPVTAAEEARQQTE